MLYNCMLQPYPILNHPLRDQVASGTGFVDDEDVWGHGERYHHVGGGHPSKEL